MAYEKTLFKPLQSLFNFVQKRNKLISRNLEESDDRAVLAICLAKIEQKLAWGASSSWATQDFEQLGEQIRLATGVTLSVTTLKRIWGKVRYDSAPTLSTLNALARFLGYANWHLYKQAIQPVAAQPSPKRPVRLTTGQPTHTHTLRWLLLGLLIGVSVLAAFFIQQPRALQPGDFVFRSRRVTRGLPNSVIFTYGVTKAPTDSVFIQQSWDQRRRVRVDKHQSTHTSIYYEPGYYQAKLVVGNQVVQEQPLLIPSDGWLATVSTASIPIYLNPSAYVKTDGLVLPLDTLRAHEILMQPRVPITKFFNVGSFEAVPLTNFSFSSKVKNDYQAGEAPCQFCWIILVTDGVSVTIPLGQSGCVSELNLLDGQQIVSGKTTDLSAFGTDVSQWVQINCKSEGQTLNYLVNGRLVYRSRLPLIPPKVVGLIYAFQGTGSVRDIKITSADKTIFKAF